MILCIRTESKEAFVALHDGQKHLSEHSWQAHRELSDTLLKVIEQELAKQDANWDKLTGLIFFKGPGSFTGLRIGVTVANTLANSQKIPIVGETGNAWITSGVSRLSKGDNDTVVVPEYGGEANITKPRK